MGIISFAQNFEDVILWRALQDVEHGCYVDIGAQHPVQDSVSKAFYDRGWRGVNIEPTSFYADLLRRERPDETVIQAVIAEQPGLLPFYEIPDTGLSTASADVAAHHRQRGFSVRETVVTALTLDELFQRVDRDAIHWLKIDVEGYEKQVLSGWTSTACRPWILVIESTYPTSRTETYGAWEHLVLAKGYEQVFCDGLNRYYLSSLKPELKDAFRAGPNIFDGFQLTESSWAAHAIRQSHAAQLSALSAEGETLRARVVESHRALERSVSDAAVQRKTFTDLARQAAERTRQDAERHLRQSIERERAHTAQLLRSQEEARRTYAESKQNIQAGEHSKVELAELRGAVARAESEAASRKDMLSSITQQLLERSRQEGEARLRELIQRERVFAERLDDTHRASQRRLTEETQRHAQKEENLVGELNRLRQAKIQVDAHLTSQEVALREAHRQQQELRFHIGLLTEQGAERLATLRTQVAALSEQLQAHAHREQALLVQLSSSREMLQSQLLQTAEREAKLIQETAAAHEAAKDAVGELRVRERELVDELAKSRGRTASIESQLQKLDGANAALRSDLLSCQKVLTTFTAELRRLTRNPLGRLVRPLRHLEQILELAQPISRPELLAPTTELTETLQTGSASLNSASEFEGPSSIDHDKNIMPMIRHASQLLELHGAAFLQHTYQALLGRDPDAEGNDYYLGRLRSGHGKLNVIAQIARSPECRARNLAMPGLPELIAEDARARHWLWGWFSRNQRLVNNCERLEWQLGKIERQLAAQEGLILSQFAELERKILDFPRQNSASASPGDLRDPVRQGGFARPIPHQSDFYSLLKSAIAEHSGARKS